jgi:hypothetical protein
MLHAQDSFAQLHLDLLSQPEWPIEGVCAIKSSCLIRVQRHIASGSPSCRFSTPVHRYGHANFTSQEILGAFSLLVQKAGQLSSH